MSVMGFPMGCGNCGVETFSIFTDGEDQRVYTKCTGCDAVSIILVAPSRIQIHWEEDNEKGVLAIRPGSIWEKI